MSERVYSFVAPRRKKLGFEAKYPIDPGSPLAASKWHLPFGHKVAPPPP